MIDKPDPGGSVVSNFGCREAARVRNLRHWITNNRPVYNDMVGFPAVRFLFPAVIGMTEGGKT